MGNQSSKGGKQTKPTNPKSAKVPPPPPVDSESEKKIKIEKAILMLDRNIKQFQDKQKKNDLQVEQLKAKAKQLLQMQKKAQAKKYLQTATRLKKQGQNFTLRRKALQNKKFQLETNSMDKDTVNALETAQQELKDQAVYAEKLENIIMDSNQHKMLQDEMNDKLRDLVEDDEQQQDIENLMAQLQAQTKKQKRDKIVGKNQGTTVNTGPKQKQKNTEQDQISRMMAQI